MAETTTERLLVACSPDRFKPYKVRVGADGADVEYLTFEPGKVQEVDRKHLIYVEAEFGNRLVRLTESEKRNYVAQVREAKAREKKRREEEGDEPPDELDDD